MFRENWCNKQKRHTFHLGQYFSIIIKIEKIQEINWKEQQLFMILTWIYKTIISYKNDTAPDHYIMLLKSFH